MKCTRRGADWTKRFPAIVDAARKIKAACNRGIELSASSAESFAKAALSPNKKTDEKIELVAKAMIELAKTIGTMERDISRIKNAVNAIRPEA